MSRTSPVAFSSPPAESHFDADAVAAAVSDCPSVVSLSGGRLGEVATYLPGRRVSGVRICEGTVEVHIVARWVESLPAVADEVRTALRPVVGTRPVAVFIEDVTVEIPIRTGAS